MHDVIEIVLLSFVSFTIRTFNLYRAFYAQNSWFTFNFHCGMADLCLMNLICILQKAIFYTFACGICISLHYIRDECHPLRSTFAEDRSCSGLGSAISSDPMAFNNNNNWSNNNNNWSSNFNNLSNNMNNLNNLGNLSSSLNNLSNSLSNLSNSLSNLSYNLSNLNNLNNNLNNLNNNLNNLNNSSNWSNDNWNSNSWSNNNWNNMMIQNRVSRAFYGFGRLSNTSMRK